MKNFSVPDHFTKFLESEEAAGSLEIKNIDFRTLYQYTLKYSSEILYNTDFENKFKEELQNYIALLYGSAMLTSNYFKENGVRIVENILKFVHEIVYKYNQELFIPGKKPIVVNGSKAFFTVEYFDVD